MQERMIDKRKAATGFNRSLRVALVEMPFLGPLITLVMVYLAASLFVPNFASMRTFTGILNASVDTGIVAIGIALLMITGEFDLSVGAMFAAGGYIFGYMVINGYPPVFAVILATLIPGLMGMLNGLILVWTGIHSFVVTLGTRSIYRALVWIISGGVLLQTQETPPVFGFLNGRLDVINNLFEKANFRTSFIWFLVLVILFEIILTLTVYGNHIFATGGKRSAAASQGVNTNYVRVMNFAIAGALAGFAGLVSFSQFRSVRVATGAGVELDAIAAVVVGGILLTGGVGSIWGALIGVLLISTLRSAVILLGLPADNFEAIVGVTIVIAAILNTLARRNTR